MPLFCTNEKIYQERVEAMKAAIIDDEVRDQDRLAECFKRIRAELKEPMEVQKFLSGEEFLRAKDDSFDLICLDIDMKGKNGIQIAKEIRKNNTQVFIIFITNMAQMAIRGYEVQAFDFILKPVNYFSFSMKIKNLANLVNSRKTKKSYFARVAAALQSLEQGF